MGWSGQVVLAATGPVEIVADDYVKTDINSNTTTAKKNVKLTSEKGLIEADQLDYDGNSGLVKASGGVKLTTTEGLIIQSGQLVYDFNAKKASASEGVTLKAKNGDVVEAEQLIYDGNSGLVNASGGVKITTGQAVYQTEIIEYNLIDAKGSLGRITGVINAKDRNYLVTGDSMEKANGVTKITNAKITRCERSDPEYLFVAKSAIYDGYKIHLKNIFLYVKGIPVFYFPVLTLNMNNKDLPYMELAYGSDERLNLKYKSSISDNSYMNWKIKGELSQSNEYSDIGLGNEFIKGNTKNYAGINYNFKEYWGIEDQLTNETPLLLSKIDGSQEFFNRKAIQLGFSVTRKYWDSSVGKWQFGVLGRKVYAWDDSGAEYGGIYGGYRLDYKPLSYLTLSLLRLDSFAGGDYRDFMDDFKIGSNWLYNLVVPLNTVYSFGLDGNYNSDQTMWVHQIYRIYHDTDCLQISFGWDNVRQSTVFTGKIKF